MCIECCSDVRCFGLRDLLLFIRLIIVVMCRLFLMWVYRILCLKLVMLILGGWCFVLIGVVRL